MAIACTALGALPDYPEYRPVVVVSSNRFKEDFDKYYKPAEFEGMDMLRSDAKWSWFRSKQSEHFFVFWEEVFGKPQSTTAKLSEDGEKPVRKKKDKSKSSSNSYTKKTGKKSSAKSESKEKPKKKVKKKKSNAKTKSE
jgi:hypothetical protein